MSEQSQPQAVFQVFGQLGLVQVAFELTANLRWPSVVAPPVAVVVLVLELMSVSPSL